MRLLLVLAVACQAPPPAAELLRLEELSPTRADPGATLTVRARSLPTGRRGRLRLVGTFHRPGASPRSVEIELPARAVAEDRAEATLDRAAVARLGGRGTLHGEAVLSFDAAQGGQVSGRLPVELDVGPASVLEVRELARREARAPAELGLVLTGDDAAVRVAEVMANSRAARAGVQPGDRLVSLGGVRIRSGADLALTPGVDRLIVERPGIAGDLILRLPDAGDPSTPTGWLLFVLPLVAFWLLGPGMVALRRATPRGAIPRPWRWIVFTSAAGLSALLLGWRPINVATWLAASLVLRAAAAARAPDKRRLWSAELALWLAVAAICVSTGSLSTGAAWSDAARCALARAPLLWGLGTSAVLALAGAPGLAADVHRALAATLVLALATGGLGGGPWLVVGATALAAVAAWLPPRATRWALPTACVLAPLHVAATLLARPPSAHESLAIAAAAVLLPALALAWPRRRVPRLHAYL